MPSSKPARELTSKPVLYPGTRVGRGTKIEEYSLIGKPYRLVDSELLPVTRPTRIGAMCQIGSHVIIGKGTTIGRGCDIEDHIQIEQSVTIGKRCHVIYKSIICNDASIGDDCVIGGFVGERTKIANNVRMFGSTVHSQSDPTLGWDETPDERAPEIRKWSFIGFGATIAGGITIGPQSYVLSNSLVTRRVPPKHIACGFNTIVPYEKWSGHLKESPLFKGERT